MRWFKAVKTAFRVAADAHPFGPAVLLVGPLLLVAIVWGVLSDQYASYHAKHLSPAEHLRMAQEDCPGAFTCIEPWASQAVSHLEKIPASAPEYPAAAKLLSSIKAFRDKEKAMNEKLKHEQDEQRSREQAERSRLMSQSEKESDAQMTRNLSGQAHDAFMCDTAANGSPIMSFDFGHYWWEDDGRCAAQIADQREVAQRAQQLREQAREQAEQSKREEEQRKRDQDAESNSYWPTTIRVDTDMDSFWLANEERMCQTYPDGNGRVAVVACNTSGTHRDHNIPVKFWGGVDRNKISDWKCRREGEEFVCRALD